MQRTREELLQEYRQKKILQKNNPNIPKPSVKKNATKASVQSDIKETRQIKKEKQVGKTQTKVAKKEKQEPVEIADFEGVSDRVVLAIELDAKNRELQELLEAHKKLKSKLESKSDLEKESVVNELIEMINTMKEEGKSFEDLVQQLQKLSQIASPGVSRNIANSKEIGTQTMIEGASQQTNELEISELKKELSDAYLVIDHMELKIHEFEVMELVHKSEILDLKNALESALLENKNLEKDVSTMREQLNHIQATKLNEFNTV
jgi:hypothetical protein